MKAKNFSRGSALITSVALVALASAPASAAETVAQADASAIAGTGLFGILNTGTHTAVHDGVGETTTGDTNVDLPAADVALQEATAGLNDNGDGTFDGYSSATASTAGIELVDAANLDLTDTVAGLIDVNDLLGTGIDLGALEGLLLTVSDLIAPVDDALQDALDQVLSALPISLNIGAVEAQCEAVPGEATGNGTVAGVDLTITLGDQAIAVPITLGTAPNSDLVAAAPQDLLNGVLDGLQDTLTETLGGALADLNPLLEALVGDVIINNLVETLEPTLLEPLSAAIEGIISGTVNKQEPVSPTDGEITVTALSLSLLGSGNTLDVAKVHCGPNSVYTPGASPTPTPTDPGETPEVPKTIDSGENGVNPFAVIGGLLAASAAIGVAGHRVATRRS